MQPIAIIQHVADDGPSYFATYLDRVGVPYRVYEMFAGAALPASVTEFSGLCLLGGPMSASDDIAYFPDLMALIRHTMLEDVSIIGHCLGGQLMAKALGATIQASPNVEIGWSDLQLEDETKARWLGGAKSARLFQWHGESFSIPVGARRLMTGSYCANQAFVVARRHLAMQFHCEVDAAKVRTWLINGHDELIRSASPAVQSAESILATLEQDILASQRTADAIYGAWFDHFGVPISTTP